MATENKKSVILAELHDKMFRLEFLNGRYYLVLPNVEGMLKKARGTKKQIIPFFELKKLEVIVDELLTIANTHAKERRK